MADYMNPNIVLKQILKDEFYSNNDFWLLPTTSTAISTK